MFHRVALHGTLVHLESAAARLVGHGHHRTHVETGLEQRIKRAAGELRRTHVDNPDAAEILAEEVADLEIAAFDPLAQILEEDLVAVEVDQRRVLGGTVGQVDADRQQYSRGNKSALERGDGSLAGQLLAGDIDDVIDQEKED